MMNKKGISGIELVVSFVIFLSFLVFLFAYLNPLRMPVQPNLLSSLENAVNENTSINILVQPFAINAITGSCFIINENLDKAFITDSSGNEISFNKTTKSINYTGKFYYINKANITGKQATFSGCITLKKDLNYSLSVPRTERIYYNKSFSDLEEMYNASYENLKNSFKIPASSDFAIIVLDSEQKEIIRMAKPIPNINVLSKEFPIEILSNESGIKISKGYLRLLVW